jgi:hypothetical protein
VAETRETHAEETFRTDCESAAARYAAGEVDLITAVDALQNHAFAFGLDQSIGQDAVQAIMATAFGSKLDDKSATHVARTVVDAVEYLIRENDPKHFETWLLQHSAAARAAIVAQVMKRGKAQCRQVIAAWVQSGLLFSFDYKNRESKLVKGLKVDDLKRPAVDRSSNGGQWRRSGPPLLPMPIGENPTAEADRYWDFRDGGDRRRDGGNEAEMTPDDGFANRCARRPVRVVAGCTPETICQHCHQPGDVKRVVDATVVGGKSETLHEACAAAWFTKLANTRIDSDEVVGDEPGLSVHQIGWLASWYYESAYSRRDEPEIEAKLNRELRHRLTTEFGVFSEHVSAEFERVKDQVFKM